MPRHVAEDEERPVRVQGQPFEEVAADAGEGAVEVAELVAVAEVDPGGQHGVLQEAGQIPVARDPALQGLQRLLRLVGVDDLLELGQHEDAVRVLRNIVGVRVFDDTVEQLDVRPVDDGRHEEDGEHLVQEADCLSEEKALVDVRAHLGDDGVELLLPELFCARLPRRGRRDGDVGIAEDILQ